MINLIPGKRVQARLRYLLTPLLRLPKMQQVMLYALKEA